MAVVTLTSITCNSTVNNAGDMIFLHINYTRVGTLFFGGAATKSLPSINVGSNALIEIFVRINGTDVDQGMGQKSAAFNPSPIPYILALGNYGLNYV